MSEARDRILQRLRANRPIGAEPPARFEKPLNWSQEERIERFTERMRAVRGEVHRVKRADWVNWITTEMEKRGLGRGLVGTGRIGEQFAAGTAPTIQVTRYDRPIEQWKKRLFNDIEFSITGSLGGLAETGSLVLWPDAEEPRLMSLVPPLHIALLEADKLYQNFADLVARENWSNGMPTNALLISGPSKTADIEQTLAYGIHGPKALLTLILEDG